LARSGRTRLNDAANCLTPPYGKSVSTGQLRQRRCSNARLFAASLKQAESQISQVSKKQSLKQAESQAERQLSPGKALQGEGGSRQASSLTWWRQPRRRHRPLPSHPSCTAS
jgi:hypothetical protein